MAPISAQKRDSSRRDFLLSAGVFAAAFAGTRLEASSADESSRSSQPQSRPSAQPASEHAVGASPGVTKLTLAEAEKLAGIAFTDSEREQMIKTIGDQLGRLRGRASLGYLPNTLAPATVFNPVIPGVAFERSFPHLQSLFTRTSEDPGPVPSDDQEVAFAPLTKLSRWVERREISSTRLTEIYLERLYRLDSQLKCVITFCEGRARKQAARADAELANGHYRGPLHGIPWGAKDLLDTIGIRTTWGAEPFVRRMPTDDANVVKMLDDAGAILVAKLSLGALAYNDTWFGGRTNNPWKLDQGSSGSSAGSAAATAAGLVGFSIGSETYGSITSPCLRCGTTGLRPTFGRVSRAGAMSLCWSLDKLGPICRRVEDCMLVLAAINGSEPDAADPAAMNVALHFNASRSVIGLRVGFDPKWFQEKGTTELDRQALEALNRTGVKLVDVSLPDWPYDTLLNILLCEGAAAFEEITRENVDDTLKWQDAEAWPNTFRQSWFIPGIEKVQADRFRRQCMQMMATKFENLDAMVSPSFAGSLCLITNNTGHPSLTVRTGFSPEGTPHGITLIGRLFDEGTLCRIGMALEAEVDVWSKRPPI